MPCPKCQKENKFFSYILMKLHCRSFIPSTHGFIDATVALISTLSKCSPIDTYLDESPKVFARVQGFATSGTNVLMASRLIS